LGAIAPISIAKNRIDPLTDDGNDVKKGSKEQMSIAPAGLSDHVSSTSAAVPQTEAKLQIAG
jgi:hypothetical protein